MDFIVKIDDSNHLAGIDAACAKYNESQAHIEGFVPLDSAGYVKFVMEKAAESYAKSYGFMK